MKHYVVEILAEVDASDVKEAVSIVMERIDRGHCSGALQFAARLSEWQLSQDAYEQSRKDKTT